MDGRIFEKRLSNALRNGGRDAIRMPIDSSAELQIARGVPVQVGSLVCACRVSMEWKTEASNLHIPV